MKKRLFLILFTLLLTAGLFAQESITNIVVTPKTDGTGIVDVYYDLSGPESSYTISLEASLDGGTNYTTVDNTCITGDIGSVAPGTGKYLIWDGICTYPEAYSSQTKVKLIAIFSGGVCGEPITDIDGNTYNTVQIGNQCWMRENLKTTHYSDATPLVDGTGTGNITGDYTTKYFFNYDDNPTLVETYGRLYTWAAIMNDSSSNTNSIGPQGVCPTGWHVPSDIEWKELEIFLGMSQEQADATQFRGAESGKLREAGTQHWTSPNSGATNSSGFTALPGGGRYHTAGGEFHDIFGMAEFWSATTQGDHAPFIRFLFYFMDGIYRDNAGSDQGYSVRCLKDEQNQPPTQPENPVPADNEIEVSLYTSLSWTCNDPENDPITYDIYFGTSNPPLLVTTGQSNETYNPGTLNLNTIYYWQIIAHDDNANQTVGSVWNFTSIAANPFQCGDQLIDTRDSQTYNTIQIGTQCWMAENLNVGTRIDGVNEQTNNSLIEKYCYDNDPAYCSVYGGLYQWDEMMQYVTTEGAQGICPTDWHLPTDNEWKTMEMNLGMTQAQADATGWRGTDEGGKLKETGTAHWITPNTGATNSSGFTALPASYRNWPGTFGSLTYFTTLWSSSENGINAWHRQLWHNGAKVYRLDYQKVFGQSVRCLKN